MFTLYAIPVSLYCAKVRIVLRHKARQWQEQLPPGGYGSDTYKTHVPSGNLPALIDGDLRLADSEAIAEYLNDIEPEPAMLPADARLRAKARELGRFHDTRLEPAVRRLFPEISATPGDVSLRMQQAGEISRRLRQLAQMLDSTAVQELWLCHCGFAVTFCWIEALDRHFNLAIIWPEAIKIWRVEIESHAAVAVELRAYRPFLDQWISQNAA